jgi:small subunit ribosomal protein S8
MTNDLISNMLTKLRNANLVKHNSVTISYSNTIFGILKLFLQQGYIKDLQLFIKPDNKKEIKIFLKYKGIWIKKPVFSTIKRISVPGKRIFSSYKDFSKKVLALKTEQGIAIISTSSGIITHIKAKKLKKGGEILCYIE